jgi:two-component system OmpR family sensor kinase
MTVRYKITLLITAAGFISSLLFSCIILWEMLEQPFHLIDADLESTARRAVQVVFRRDEKKGSDAQWSISGERYWLEIKDQDSGKSVYRSDLAKLFEIPHPNPGSGDTVSVIIPREKTDLGQDRQNEVTFRVRESRISLGEGTFLVCVGLPIENLEEEFWDTITGVASGLVFSGLLLMGISYFVAGFILKPVRIINDQALDISEKHLDRRMPVSDSRDEFNALAQTLNKVFDRLQHAFLRQKRLLADASHELKTPLTMIRLALDEIRSGLSEASRDPQVESHERMTEQVLRMERLVKSLLDLSSLEIEATAKKDQINLANILNALIADYRFLAEPRNIRINATLPGQIEVEGDAEKLHRAFSSILDNAVKYNMDGGQIIIVGDQSEDGPTITISNTGPGVPEAEIPKVFDQFYRVDQSRAIRHGGSGLGLAIVKRIVELHGGKVKFDSQLGGWTQMTVSLPQHRKMVSI